MLILNYTPNNMIIVVWDCNTTLARGSDIIADVHNSHAQLKFHTIK